MDIGAREIDEWHRNRNPPFRMIGYHHVIRRNGDIEGGRSHRDKGAHVKGHNHESIGVCLVGGLDENRDPEDNYTGDQWASLLNLLHSLKAEFPHAEILGHRDLSPDINGDGIIEEWEWLKICPCFDVRSKINEWGLV